MDSSEPKQPEVNFDPELSLLEINRPVSAQTNERILLLEQMRFLWFSSPELDEYLEVRIPGAPK